MNALRLFDIIKSTTVMIMLVVVGFSGMLIYTGLTDTGGADAASVLYVGNDSTYKSISAAIAAALPGDVIYIKNGTYFENVVVNKPNISLIGNSTKNTMINGNGAGDVMRITQDWVNVSGLTLVNSGTSDPPTYDCGLEINTVNNVTINRVNCSYNRLGLYLLDSQDINILNSTFYANFYQGIYLSSSNDNIIRNNSCIKNRDNGIYTFNSKHNVYQENTVQWNSWYGIRLDVFSDNNDVVDNTASNNNLSGILLRLSDRNTVENNVCGYNQFFAIYSVQSSFTTYSSNICISQYGTGIALVSSIENVLTGNGMYVSGILIDGSEPVHWNSHTIDTLNTVNDRAVHYWKFQNGGTVPADAGQVIIVNSTNVVVENQDIYHTPAAVEVGYSSSISISNNNLSNNVYGLLFFNSDDSAVENNTISVDTVDGAMLVLSYNNMFYGNSVKGNHNDGISFSSASNNTITECSFTDNQNNGLYLFDSKSNVIGNNRISSNAVNGLFINATSNRNILKMNNISDNGETGVKILESDNNKIYFNNFADNTVQAGQDAGSANSWDNSAGEGNYWSDYAGLDNGAGSRIRGDGIGDTQLPHLGLDNYPFVNISGWMYPGIPQLLDPGDLDTDGNYTVRWNHNRGTVKYQLEEAQDASFSSPTVVYEGPGLSINMTGKQNGTYYYRLKAYSEDHESPYSNTVDMIVNWFPAVPVNFKVASYPGGNALNLSWDLNLVDTKEYEIYSNASGFWEKIGSVNHPGRQYNHTGLTDGVRYYYKIRARDSMDQFSNFSAVVSGVPGDKLAPAAPTGLRIASVTYSTITLSWNNNTESDLQGYRIYRGNISNPDAWGDLIGTTLPGETTFTDSGRNELTTYVYRTTAVDEVPWESDFSNEASAKTSLGPHPPVVNNTYVDNFQGRIQIEEDSYTYDRIDLTRMFIDINNDVLVFNASMMEHIEVIIFQGNGTVVLKPEHDWSGNQTLTITAWDGKYEVSYNLTITVVGVNDAPGPVSIISPSKGIRTTDSSSLYFEAVCDDPDIIYGDILTYTWTSSISGDLGTGANITGIDLPPGLHIINVEVRDKGGKISWSSINLTILEKDEKVDDLSGIIMPIILIVVIIVIFIIAMIIIRKKKREEETRAEGMTEVPPPVVPAEIYPPGTEVEGTGGGPASGVIPPGEPPAAAGGTIPSEPVSAPAPLEGTAPMDIQYPVLPPGAEPPYTDDVAPYIDYTRDIDRGRAYLVVTKQSQFGLDIFEKYLEKELGWGLCISRTHPDQLRSSMIMDGVKKIWLSQTAHESSISPSNLTKIAHAISEFIKSRDKCVVILDGIEYLISNNEFQKVLKFIESVHEKIVLSKAVLIIPLNPSTLSKKDFELLEKELQNSIKDPYYVDE